MKSRIVHILSYTFYRHLLSTYTQNRYCKQNGLKQKQKTLPLMYFCSMKTWGMDG